MIKLLTDASCWRGVAELAPSYKAALQACAQSGDEMLGKYDANHVLALKRIVGGSGGVKLAYWSKQIMDALHKATEEVLQEQAAADETFRNVYAKWKAFRDDQILWASVNDGAAEQ